jgi:hypothetical protein
MKIGSKGITVRRTLQFPLPFHPGCFDIVTRLSLHHLRGIDVRGLISWRNIQFSDVNIVEGGMFSSDPNVKSAAQQFWAHRTGDEYLAANPLYIPGLIPILESQLRQTQVLVHEARRLPLCLPTSGPAKENSEDGPVPHPPARDEGTRC